MFHHVSQKNGHLAPGGQIKEFLPGVQTLISKASGAQADRHLHPGEVFVGSLGRPGREVFEKDWEHHVWSLVLFLLVYICYVPLFCIILLVSNLERIKSECFGTGIVASFRHLRVCLTSTFVNIKFL